MSRCAELNAKENKRGKLPFLTASRSMLTLVESLKGFQAWEMLSASKISPVRKVGLLPLFGLVLSAFIRG